MLAETVLAAVFKQGTKLLEHRVCALVAEPGVQDVEIDQAHHQQRALGTEAFAGKHLTQLRQKMFAPRQTSQRVEVDFLTQRL